MKKVKTKLPNTKKSKSKKALPKKSSIVNYENTGAFGVWYRPNRKDYILKVKEPRACVFCEAESKGLGLDSLCLYQSKNTMIILNKFPYNSGHLLILPRKHVGDILSLSDLEFLDLNQTVKLAIEAMKACYNPPGFNLGLNHGSAAGAGIPDHMHYHLVPRWAGDLNFLPLIAGVKNVIETPEQAFDKYLEFFKKN